MRDYITYRLVKTSAGLYRLQAREYAKDWEFIPMPLESGFEVEGQEDLSEALAAFKLMTEELRILKKNRTVMEVLAVYEPQI